MIRLRSTELRRIIAAGALAAAAATLTAPALSAQKANDPAGDYLAGYGGAKNGDLDVVSAQVFYDPAIQKFAFTATMNAAIGTTPGGLYVWGLNKGNGNQGFPIIAPGVRFDAVMIMRPLTGMTVGAAPVHDFFYFSGNTITGVAPLSFFPSTGFTPENYTWNLWPRATGPVGDAQIADFAPDNSNNQVTVGPIPAALLAPEPASIVLVGTGLLGMFVAARRRRV